MKNIKYKRPNIDEWCLMLKDTVGKRATCSRGRSGCVIAKDGHVIATGYVGAPSGLPDCDEVGHLFQSVINSDDTISEHCIRTVHAEQNAICQAAKFGISVNGATLYCTMTPCRVCAMLIINSGIKHIYCDWHYPNQEQDDNVITMLNYVGIDIHFANKETIKYEED